MLAISIEIMLRLEKLSGSVEFLWNCTGCRCGEMADARDLKSRVP